MVMNLGMTPGKLGSGLAIPGAIPTAATPIAPAAEAQAPVDTSGMTPEEQASLAVKMLAEKGMTPTKMLSQQIDPNIQANMSKMMSPKINIPGVTEEAPDPRLGEALEEQRAAQERLVAALTPGQQARQAQQMQQQALAQMLTAASQAREVDNTLAQQQLQQGLRAAQGAIAGALSSQRGNPGLAMRRATQVGAGMAQEAAGQSAALQAQQEQQALAQQSQLLGQVLGGASGVAAQDLRERAAQAQAAGDVGLAQMLQDQARMEVDKELAEAGMAQREAQFQQSRTDARKARQTGLLTGILGGVVSAGAKALIGG